MTSNTPQNKDRKQSFVILITIICTIIATTAIMALVIKYYLFPSPLKPVTLNTKEKQKLSAKLERLNPGLRADIHTGNTLKPEPYTESKTDRKISFTEREINALLAHNTNLADKLAIDFSDNMISAKMLVPMDKDFPLIGGRIIRVNMGMTLEYKNAKPVAILRGISLMGVPLPNAWIGNLKNIDLIQEFGDQNGFWHSFSEGVQDVQVIDGSLKIELRE